MNTIYIHPMIVHFPVALFIAGAFAALLSKIFRHHRMGGKLYAFAGISMIAGALGAIGAVLSGFLFTKEMIGIMGELRQTHILFAFISVICGSIAAILMGISLFSDQKRSGLLQDAGVVTSLLTAVLIGITGHYGGMMVFGA